MPSPSARWQENHSSLTSPINSIPLLLPVELYWHLGIAPMGAGLSPAPYAFGSDSTPELPDPDSSPRLSQKLFHGCPDGDRVADGAGASELERANARLEKAPLMRITIDPSPRHMQGIGLVPQPERSAIQL